MIFYLGTHETSWLARAGVPLMVSHRRLATRRSLPRAIAPWTLDSGGFTELNLYGRWVTGVDEYVAAVARYREQIGLLQWAAPQDWMCEPVVLEKTGLSVREHQERTVVNYLALRGRGPFIPVIQGWEPIDYQNHVNMYAQEGVSLAALPVVGVGTVCRRQGTDAGERIVRVLDDLGVRLHGFGIKISGFARYGSRLTSSDSLAWSLHARMNRPLAGHTHKSCSNCLDYALRWRAGVLARGIQEEFAFSTEDRRDP